jgi:RimJ/RimL family protein N-acetyltransferase
VGLHFHQLPDGTVVTFRAIRPDDRVRLQDSHARLSPASRYRRFMAAKPRLSGADARYLADVDGHDHVAVVATVTDGGAERIIGVGRVVRIAGEPGVGEFAIVVGDAWQNRGLGSLLLAALGEAAQAQGIVRLRASMLADNAPIHRLIARYAAGPVHHRRDGAVCEVEFALPPAPTQAARAA